MRAFPFFGIRIVGTATGKIRRLEQQAIREARNRDLRERRDAATRAPGQAAPGTGTHGTAVTAGNVGRLGRQALVGMTSTNQPCLDKEMEATAIFFVV